MTVMEMKDLCKSKRITYAKLAEASGVSEGVIKNIFSGFTQNPRIDTMNKLEYGIRLLCDFPSKTLTQETEYSKDEKKLIEMYRQLSDGMKKNIFEMIQSLSGGSTSNIKKYG